MQAVDVRLEAGEVDRPPVRRAHRGTEGSVSEQKRRRRTVRTYISCGVKTNFSRVWFHILRRFPALCFLL